MKILHTSDWHIGRCLGDRTRYDEWARFLDWLADLIRSEAVDALLVAGDVFDTTTPGNRAQELYYRFLYQVARSECRQVVIVGGNHDSPSFLNAPRALLQALDVHVIGCATEDPADEVITLHDAAGAPTAIVCAVPYLRDRDLRTARPGESLEDKRTSLLAGLQAHYAAVGAIAESRRRQMGEVPIVAMGHLFTAGGRTTEGDGVRELYVGTLAHADAAMFADSLDYVALGHLHVPQRVGRTDHIRYSGSPLPMGFGEARQTKQVLLVAFAGRAPQVREVAVPCFQPLERVCGDLAAISDRIAQLKVQASSAWLEVEYTGTEIVANLQGQIDALVADTRMEVRLVRNRRVVSRALRCTAGQETLEQLDQQEVFARCLVAHEVPDAQRPALQQAYCEIIAALDEDDPHAP